LEITGGTGLGTVSVEGGDAYTNRGNGILRVVVVLEDAGPIRVRVPSGEVRDLPQVEVLQVADGSDALRESLAGYSVEVYALGGGGS
jgi:hypothetical protein